MTATLGKSTAGHAIAVDVPRLVASRLLLQANSGGGKSWAIRRLLEQTHGAIQHLVIDSEGEFHTLREKFDYVLAAPREGDCIATPQTADLLARRLLELNVSAILDIYELKAHERVLFVKRFLGALVNAPRKLWHPALVVVDEAHVFCPQTGSAESAGAVIDLMTRGRKRGFCGVLATQRISKLHKDAAAEANNKLIGRSALDVDMKRAGDELGFSGREQQIQLRGLKDGEFFAFGPALSGTVERIQVGPVATTHPRAGQEAPPPTAPSTAIKSALAKMTDLPQEAEAEVKTLADLQHEIRSLRGQLTAAKRGGASKEEVEAARREGAEQATAAAQAEMALRLSQVGTALVPALRALEAAQAALDVPGVDVPKAQAPRNFPPPQTREQKLTRAPAAPATKPAQNIPRNIPAGGNGAALPGPQARVLNAIAWWEAVGIDRPNRIQVAFVAGYKPNTGAFNNTCGALRTAGLVDYPIQGLVSLTDGGRAHAVAPGGPQTTEALHDMILARLTTPQRRVLAPLLETWPDQMSAEQVAEAAGYAVNTGAFNNTRGSLRSLGIVDYPQQGWLRAEDILFLKA